MDLKMAIFRYCDYQERCQQEVRNKLYSLQASPAEVENLIATLIEENLLNEERFGRAYARGKFRIKGWGKVKIVQHLKQCRLSEFCIKKAMSEIDQQAYYDYLLKLTHAKWTELRNEKVSAIRKNKTFRFLMQRGFESTLIIETLAEVMNNGNHNQH